MVADTRQSGDQWCVWRSGAVLLAEWRPSRLQGRPWAAVDGGPGDLSMDGSRDLHPASRSWERGGLAGLAPAALAKKRRWRPASSCAGLHSGGRGGGVVVGWRWPWWRWTGGGWIGFGPDALIW